MSRRPPPSSVPVVPYAELHCHSAFSFLDGASQPEDLVAEAVRLGLSALALTDHDGMYGIVRFAEAAVEAGLPTVFGTEVSFGSTVARSGDPDPGATHLVILARDAEGYRRLSRAVSDAHLAGGEKGVLVAELEAFAAASGGHWQVLTGCRKGAVPRALSAGGQGTGEAVRGGPAPGGFPGMAAARTALDELVALFGRENVAVELWDHAAPLDSDRNDALAALAREAGLPVVASGNVHYATPASARLAAAMSAVRARRSLDEMEGWLPAAGTAHLRSGAEMSTRFGRYPGAVDAAARIGAECAFGLDLVAPRLPDFPVPPGHDEASWLRLLTMQGAARRYGPSHAERVAGAYDQLVHELRMIEQLGFPGYFLIVHDIVEFCRENEILCQGRGSAANSAVCYALGITNVDAVSYGLLFERFLAPEREGPPDIDVDIESGRREEVIQYVYGRYGRDRAAQVANVITYRPRSAVRDVARALGFSAGQQDAWSRRIDRRVLPTAGRPEEAGGRGGGRRSGGGRATETGAVDASAGSSADSGIPAEVLELADQLLGFPRHLGIHSGGMVICDRPVAEVVPVEWARMPGRTVVQWDKDDCAAAGLVKFDLLGLGMLSMLHGAFDLIRAHHGRHLDLASIPPEDPAVYDMLCAADSVGVFQVESRAQMSTLPRLRPRRFYDLVVEVALIRPGPIQGGSVHPYIRRRSGAEEVVYPHPLLRRSLEKTLGVPLFQEQLMQMAIDIAGFTPAEADQLRRAMGSRRATERIDRLRARLYEGMAANGITGETADDLYAKLVAFASFGFPESHSVSFAFLVYASSWIKLYYPAAFCAALLNAQPMGFYSPQSLVADARRHGVVVHGPDLNASAAGARLTGSPAAVRLGLAGVRRLGDQAAERIVAERDAHGPYQDMSDLVRRVGLRAEQIEALATAGAFDCFGLARREALWAAGAVAQARPDRLAGMVFGADVSAVATVLPGMSEAETVVADLWATGITPGCYPTEIVRCRLDEMGVVVARRLRDLESGRRVLVAGVVTHRQRPQTAGGTTFVSLEDETGLVNVICSRGVWARYRSVAGSAAALIVRGRLESAQGAVNVIAESLRLLPLAVGPQSRDFR